MIQLQDILIEITFSPNVNKSLKIGMEAAEEPRRRNVIIV